MAFPFSPTRIVSFLKEAGERRLPLVLEGVWEEGRKMWHVRTKGFDHDHLVPLSESVLTRHILHTVQALILTCTLQHLILIFSKSFYNNLSSLMMILIKILFLLAK